jgi:hypothetical protein
MIKLEEKWLKRKSKLRNKAVTIQVAAIIIIPTVITCILIVTRENKSTGTHFTVTSIG